MGGIGRKQTMVKCCFIMLLAMPTVVVSLAITHDENRELGQSLASSLTKSLETLQALQNEGQGEDASYYQHLRDTLLSKQEVLVSPKVAEAIARANSLAGNHQAPKDGICVRDWSHPCPDGWELVGGSACAAPKSYKGGCGTLQKFGTATWQTKQTFASTCKAPWPCDENDGCTQGRDYEICPLGWDAIGSGYCKQINPDSAKCGSVFNFADMDISDKQDLSNDCGWHWACRAPCVRDFSAKCPEGWQENANLCVAPDTYAGDCGYSFDTEIMNEAEKQIFASKCAVQFPCVGGLTEQLANATRRTEPHLVDGPIESNSENVLEATLEVDAGLPEEWFKMPSGPVDSKGGIRF